MTLTQLPRVISDPSHWVSAMVVCNRHKRFVIVTHAGPSWIEAEDPEIPGRQNKFVEGLLSCGCTAKLWRAD